ncbi:MAG: hypothetical protein LBJ20_03635 [Candidatus Methanoplasma sp.]|nr:hypothetical protein [Candidatus Methanoplasma sp.]
MISLGKLDWHDCPGYLEILDEIVLEQQCVINYPEAVVLCPRCSEDMEIGSTGESVDYPGIRICRKCAENEEVCGKLYPVSLNKWSFVQILRDVARQYDEELEGIV